MKQEKDAERRKMKEDIMKKMREKKRQGGDGNFKVEIVGLPDFMQPEPNKMMGSEEFNR